MFFFLQDPPAHVHFDEHQGASGFLVRPVWRRRRPRLQRASHSRAPGFHAGGRAVPDEGQGTVHRGGRDSDQPPFSGRLASARFHRHNSSFLQVSYHKLLAEALVWKIV